MELAVDYSVPDIAHFVVRSTNDGRSSVGYALALVTFRDHVQRFKEQALSAI